ncbi:DUF2309 domain-containing protein [Hydrogenothermus marinus]|uniref:Probable inorganic carbon transporter subunit DabA n=1 Tax=Hydrogenothermus marinus TaxID=133270 RepID=A0A3M0BIY9_9AQUI|nr:DUF2309 domain-containing protein [Hydrogenothermus marinus]RMA97117.1 hypothetical protein CLV39_0772 [Hydrogenothermus marinus]
MVNKNIDNIKSIIPQYWPIKNFIHHNPLKGFEKQHFKNAVNKAKEIFEGNVYMEPEYYVNLYMDGTIREDIFEENLLKVLEENNYKKYFYEAKKFLIEISPNWNKYKFEKINKCIDEEELIEFIKTETIEKTTEETIKKLIKNLTLYEIYDAIFDTNLKDQIEKDIIEFITRFLDEEQTTLSMYQRNLGMFNVFKYYEGENIQESAEVFIEKILENLKVEDKENYLLIHLLKQVGWAGFIKYRSEDKDYPFQQEYPSSIEDYLAIRLFYEHKYISKQKISDFKKLNDFINQNQNYVILKLLKYKGKLLPKFVDLMETASSEGEFKEILRIYKEEEINIIKNQILNIRKEITTFDKDIVEFAKFIYTLKNEEGYLWLKSLEDSYINKYLSEFLSSNPSMEKSYLAAAVFCIDVRSESIRRYLEKIGPYFTYGVAGFFGVPITFIELDKGHEQFLCPAIIKPKNTVFELPKEGYKEYKSRKKMFSILKNVLNDLKNNPYTPFIMVEAVGWLFGINLFGKTLFPRQIDKFFSKFRPKKPKTIYTINKLTDDEVEEFAKKVHFKIIEEFLTEKLKRNISLSEVEKVWEYLVLNKSLDLNIPEEFLEILKTKYSVNKENYEMQKEKLRQVGFTLEEKVSYVKNFLQLIGLTQNFPKFVFVFGHGSKSDNNPFESALDCGACGGGVGLPNARVISMMANDKEVRKKLLEEGINIPEYVKFIPSLHNTTTDELFLENLDILNDEELKLIEKIKSDFEKASSKSRLERAKFLPYTETEEDIFTKSCDWSEPRPEWGLSKNNAFFIGKRESTKNFPMFNRVFLHSYNWEEDEDGNVLTTIFSGPLVVGEWINMEHYFSTTDNEVFGAGSKVYHNIVSKVGVFFGNFSDLKIGLPEQTVNLADQPYHEPMRLITFVEAPIDIVNKAMQKSALSNNIIKNEWIRLVVLDRKDNKIYKYENNNFIEI